MLPFASCSPYNPSLPFWGLGVIERSMLFAIRSRKLAACAGICQHIDSWLILRRKWTYRFRKPPTTSQFKPAEMATPGSGQQDAVWCLFEFVVWDCLFDRDLSDRLVVCLKHMNIKQSLSLLTGSSSAFMAKNGMRIASSESVEDASRW